jgi:hypothetical protein
METNMAERLEQAVATLDDLIELAGECGLGESGQFLAMARLHLLIDLNEITDAEFRALCVALDRKTHGRPEPRERAPRSRVRRDGELRVMRRAWNCPQGVPVRRTRRSRTQ